MQDSTFQQETPEEMMPVTTHTAGGVVLSADKKVLVVSQRGNSWSLPKGHLEEGEDLITAAKREIYEESGLTRLEFIKELPVYERFKISADGKGEDSSEKKVIHMFLFKTVEERLQPVDPENPEARWVEVKDVEALLTHQKDKAFFEGVVGELGV